MTVSSSIPPIVYGKATILDTKTPLSFVCYWVIPFSLLGLATLASKILPDRMTPAPEDIVRKTTFVAFAEAEIDQLIYLATEHANRESGPGKEAYDIRIGSKGVPLVGDETRESWPSTYKVRERGSNAAARGTESTKPEHLWHARAVSVCQRLGIARHLRRVRSLGRGGPHCRLAIRPCRTCRCAARGRPRFGSTGVVQQKERR